MDGSTKTKASLYQVVPSDLEDDDHHHLEVDGHRSNVSSPSHRYVSPPRSASSSQYATPIRNRSLEMDDADQDETSSLVDPVGMREQIILDNINNGKNISNNNNNPKSIFREWNDVLDPNETDLTAHHQEQQPAHLSGFVRNSSRPTSPQQQQPQHQQQPTILSRHSSLDYDSDWEEEDEATLRRYHLDIVTPRTNVPLPSEFSGTRAAGGLFNSSNPLSPSSSSSSSSNTMYNRLYHSVRRCWTAGRQRWRELRQNARQRRAARLLTMPSESARHRCRACLVSWCCDATDAGIVLTAAWLTLWLVAGLYLVGQEGPSVGYWVAGLLLFAVRVTARRCYEGCCCTASTASVLSMANARQRRRQRLGSSFQALGDGSHSDHHHAAAGGVDDDDDAVVVVADHWKNSDHSMTTPSSPAVKDKDSNRDLSSTV